MQADEPAAPLPPAGALLASGERLTGETLTKVGASLQAALAAAGDDEAVLSAAAAAQVRWRGFGRMGGGNDSALGSCHDEVAWPALGRLCASVWRQMWLGLQNAAQHQSGARAGRGSRGQRQGRGREERSGERSPELCPLELCPQGALAKNCTPDELRAMLAAGPLSTAPSGRWVGQDRRTPACALLHICR